VARGYTEIVKEIYNYDPSIVTEYNIALAHLFNRFSVLEFFKEKDICTILDRQKLIEITKSRIYKADAYRKQLHVKEKKRHIIIDNMMYYFEDRLLLYLDNVMDFNFVMTRGDLVVLKQHVNLCKCIGAKIKFSEHDVLQTVLNGHLSIIKFLVENNYGYLIKNSCNIIAARRNRFEILKYLIISQINTTDISNKKEVLENAIKGGRLEIVKYLCNLGYNSENALELARKHNYEEIYDYLTQHSFLSIISLA